ncbi:hypothetical protein ACIQWZ_40080 [Streptomyces sp. NPDC098077]|uniref:hypothetical protein n=1 Tax=Streptomyces sp. NPDC098077 TaxID=3366093 RepID=UPI0038157BD5
MSGYYRHISHAGLWALTDVLALPEDPAQRVELVGGQLMMSPAPGLPHQRASHRLHNLLEQVATTAAADVEVFNIIVPDGLLIPSSATAVVVSKVSLGVADGAGCGDIGDLRKEVASGPVRVHGLPRCWRSPPELPRGDLEAVRAGARCAGSRSCRAGAAGGTPDAAPAPAAPVPGGPGAFPVKDRKRYGPP